MLLNFLVFCLALPFCVWLLAAFLAVLDQRPWYRPLMRLITYGIALTLFLLVTDRSLVYPIGYALVVVTLLHLLSGYAFRYHFLGAGELTTERPTPPMVEEVAPLKTPSEEENDPTSTGQPG